MMSRINLLFAFLLLSSVQTRLLDLDSLESTNELYDELYNKTMEWGTYKPNLFFGIKNRSPTPVTVGLLWAYPD
jgi:hypothetical protein